MKIKAASPQSLTLKNDKDGKILTANKVVLNGNWTHGVLPHIDGLSIPIAIPAVGSAMRKHGISSFVVNSAQANLAFPLFGTVRIEGKGRLDVLDTGVIRLQATMWSRETALQGQIDVTGEFDPDGKMMMNFDVTDSKIELPLLRVARIGGWVIFDRTGSSAPWSVSAQLASGAVRLFNVPLQGTAMTAQGTMQDAQLTLQSTGPDNGNSVVADARLSRQAGSSVTVTARTNNLPQAILAMLSSGSSEEDLPDALVPAVSQIVYATQGNSLFTEGTLRVADAYGRTQMTGGLRQSDIGADLDVQDISLKNLSALFALRGVQGEGPMTGLLSLRAGERGGLVIEDSLLRSAAPGVLSYDGNRLPKQMQTDRKNAVSLLKSFAYDKIEMKLNSAERGIDGDLTISGHPVLNYDQRPADMKFHFETMAE